MKWEMIQVAVEKTSKGRRQIGTGGHDQSPPYRINIQRQTTNKMDMNPEQVERPKPRDEE